MIADWETKELSAVSTISYGYTESASTEAIGPHFLRITDIQNGHVDWDNVPFCKIDAGDLSKYRLANGDIVFARTGATTGKSFLVVDPPKAVFASYLIRLRLLEKKLLPKFLSYFFQTSGYWNSIEAGSTGSAQGGFNASKLGNLSIAIPPLPEQKRIVGILDEAFDGIATAKANAEKNLQNARALFESHLHAIFDLAWKSCEIVPLSELATDITDGDHLPPPKSPSGIPFITIGNIRKETRTIDFADTFMVPEEYFNRLKMNRKPKKGDVLYTVTGSFGIPVIVEENIRFCFQRHIALVRPKPDTITAWLYYLLLSPQVFKAASDGATGAAQRTVSLKVLRNLQVPRVSPDRQRLAVITLDALVAETQRLESIYQQKLAALEELKKSLLHEAFNGRL